MRGLAVGEARDGRIKIHGPEAFEGMRRAGALAAATLDFITPFVRPGVTTGELDRLCHDFVADHNAISAPLNYRGFPKSICTSINHVVCHGIPGERRLIEGDILNIDVTPILDGWHGDTSRMFFVGERVPIKARRLVDVTYEAMMRGIAVVRPGYSHRRHRRRDPALRRGPPLFGGARLLRPWRRPHLSRCAFDPALRQPRRGAGHARGDDLHRRADDQRRTLGGEDPERRLDRSDQGPLSVGAVRAHCRSNRRRLRDLHDLARLACTARLTPSRLCQKANPHIVRGTGHASENVTLSARPASYLAPLADGYKRPRAGSSGPALAFAVQASAGRSRLEPNMISSRRRTLLPDSADRRHGAGPGARPRRSASRLPPNRNLRRRNQRRRSRAAFSASRMSAFSFPIPRPSLKIPAFCRRVERCGVGRAYLCGADRRRTSKGDGTASIIYVFGPQGIEHASAGRRAARHRRDPRRRA